MNAQTLHSKAMDSAEEAELARKKGATLQYRALLQIALDLETEAANTYLMEKDYEPTRSVLFRSAASMAVELGEWRSAEQLIASALFGNPPNEIAEELRDILETVHFRRHLEVRGLQLSESEFQMSLAGKAIGFGITLTDLFVQRVVDVEKLVLRTAERVMKKPYREHGRLQRTIQEEFSLYLSAPRASSFAVTFHLGSSKQESIPGMSLASEVVDEVVDCLEILQSDGESGLASRIQDDSYRTNFVALAKRIAPDGSSVSSVGFTSRTRDKEKRLSFTTTRDQFVKPKPTPKVVIEILSRNYVSVSGYLKNADARNEGQGIIDLIDDNKIDHKVFVPVGLMNDIVRPLFNERVIVSGYLENNVIKLEDIDTIKKESEK